MSDRTLGSLSADDIGASVTIYDGGAISAERAARVVARAEQLRSEPTP